ncbi:uncharacterized protein Smp_203860 [Schistosoma mansoni]|uniref:uncharacterized protein n=1 Tax=Schistosoma mansoni TaxID=6183 RepID=UPI00022DC9F3|nr:uncharacterized protein Smp_203860 [Schistosoma mansoni]|eukprot:XP_018655281.1 uncharacterized protein Smp_203860 [Schistosoma mansoni]
MRWNLTTFVRLNKKFFLYNDTCLVSQYVTFNATQPRINRTNYLISCDHHCQSKLLTFLYSFSSHGLQDCK